MCYIASTIAGYFIGRSNKEEQPLSVLQLIKLVYISHGWNLALYDIPLISDKIEAWKYGPVMPSLYRFFEEIGLTKDDLVNSFTIEEVNCIRAEHLELLNKVYVKYEQMTGEQLTDLMHEKDTPWSAVWNNGNGRDNPINDEATKAYYARQITKEIFDTLPSILPINSKEKAAVFLKKAGILMDNGELSHFYKNS